MNGIVGAGPSLYGRWSSWFKQPTSTLYSILNGETPASIRLAVGRSKRMVHPRPRPRRPGRLGGPSMQTPARLNNKSLNGAACKLIMGNLKKLPVTGERTGV